jgi:hypothetical protein
MQKAQRPRPFQSWRRFRTAPRISGHPAALEWWMPRAASRLPSLERMLDSESEAEHDRRRKTHAGTVAQELTNVVHSEMRSLGPRASGPIGKMPAHPTGSSHGGRPLAGKESRAGSSNVNPQSAHTRSANWGARRNGFARRTGAAAPPHRGQRTRAAPTESSSLRESDMASPSCALLARKIKPLWSRLAAGIAGATRARRLCGRAGIQGTPRCSR